MFVTTKLILDAFTGEVLDWRGHEYVGPVEEAKKGSDAAKASAAGQDKIGQTAQANATSDQATRTAAQGQAAPFVSSLMPGKNGALSTYAQSQYQNDKTQNALSAQDQRGMGMKALGLRGFNQSPGALSSVMNTTGQRQGMADTEAYNRAQQSSLGQGLAGMGYLQNQQQIYDPSKALQTGSGAYSGEANAAQVMNTSPTVMGDIGMGLMGLGQTAGSVMGGLGAMGMKV